MKRSAAIALVSMGAAAVTFYALRDVGKTSQAHVFRTVEDCILAPGIGDTRCREEYRQALATHERTAPRFENRQACEAEFGANACRETPGAAPGAAALFIPVLAGYMFGQANAGRPFAPQPLYGARPAACPPDPTTGMVPAVCPSSSTGGGGGGGGTSYRTGHGTYIWVGSGGGTSPTTTGRTATTTTVPRTVASPPPSRPNTVTRQGFGQTSRSVSVSSRGTGT